MNPFILKSIRELDSLLIKHCEVTIHELLRGLQLSFEDFYLMVEQKVDEAGIIEARQCILSWLNLTSVFSQEIALGKKFTHKEVANNAKKLGLLINL